MINKTHNVNLDIILFVLVALLPINGLLSNILLPPWNDLWQPILLGILVIGWFKRVIADGYRVPKTALLIAIFAIFVLVRSLSLPLPRLLVGNAVYLLYVPVSLWAISCSDDLLLERLLTMLTIVIVLVSAIGLIEYFSGERIYPLGTYWSAWYDNTGSRKLRLAPSIGWDTLAWATSVSVVIPLAFWQLKRSANLKKVLFGIASLILILSLILTFSRGSWISFSVAMIVWLLIKSRHVRSPSLFAMSIWLTLAVSFFILLTPIGGDLNTRVMQLFMREYTIEPRTSSLQLAFRYARDSMFLGVGPGWAEHGRVLFGDIVFNPEAMIIESGYLKILAELGLPGIFAFFIIIFTGLKKGYLSSLSNKNKGIAFPIWLGLIMMVVQLMFTQLTSSWLTNMLFWLYLGILLRERLKGRRNGHAAGETTMMNNAYN